MFRATICKKFKITRTKYTLNYYSTTNKSVINLPENADVVIIGGGSAGCHTLYHLARLGVRAVLLERAKLTAGTTWHTSGLVWRLRPNDVDIQLLARSREMLIDIKNNTEYDPGWIQNGGLFIARNKTRLEEYKRLATIGKMFNVENYILSPEETKTVFPLLNTNIITATLFSPGDGVVDPTLLCRALSQLAVKKHGASVVENCPVDRILTAENSLGKRSVTGVETPFGTINTKCIVNATGVWGCDLLKPLGINLPLISMRHAYIVTEPIEGIRGMPNIRDHDASVYFRIQGASICMGGYEVNPILLDKVASDFHFNLYELDWSTFNTHIKGSEELCPSISKVGIKTTICGPESFTPDHKPLMGPDPQCDGLFHNCGFNSAGMMFGGGCGEQLAHWIIHGRPEFHMFQYDIRRFTAEQTRDRKWATERSHESYAKNYSAVFIHDQPLAGRNFKLTQLHDEMIKEGAAMEEVQGYERPGFFFSQQKPFVVQPYDWYGTYDKKLNEDQTYVKVLEGDCKYEFSDYHHLIGKEAINCRSRASLFNLSYFYKLYVTGADAKEAIEWICTADTNKPPNSVLHTYALNKRGGVEGDYVITILDSGNGDVISPAFQGSGYYIVANGASGNHTIAHIKNCVSEKKFKVDITDVTDQMGIISIQGPESQKILQKLTDEDLSVNALPPCSSVIINILTNNSMAKCRVRALRISLVGELGFELHVPNNECINVYKAIMDSGKEFGLKNAGFRSFNSLNCEKGYHLWGYDLRSNDTPIESNLSSICRKNGQYNGKYAIEEQLSEGVSKRLAYFTLDHDIPLWGLEGVYRNGQPIGYLRRAEYGYTLERPIGKAFLSNPNESYISDEFLQTGDYHIEVMGKLYSAKCHLKSPFDTCNQRILGNY